MRTCRPTRRRASTGSRFNPRAREGRDDSRVTSISFLTKFQSTRPRGARRATDVMKEIVEPFQSTRPRGARRGVGLHRAAGVLVSIHAPTRGATRRRPAPCRWRPCFNPRAHEGRDQDNVRIYSSSQRFQSTRPRGARHRRAPRGARWRLVSIHAPTRGATYGTGRPAARLPVSIHAPTRGATSRP